MGQNKALQLHAMYPTCADLSEASRDGAHSKVETLKARLKAELLPGQKLPQAPVLETLASSACELVLPTATAHPNGCSGLTGCQ